MSTSFDIDNRGEWIYGVDLRFKGVSSDHIALWWFYTPVA